MPDPHPDIALVDIPPDGIDFFHVPFLAFGIFESLFHSFCTAFILVAMAKERVEKRHRRAAERDPLTDVPNRRGFFDLAQQMIVRGAAVRRPLALLVLDLDHFKTINDTFGHHVGDVGAMTPSAAACSRGSDPRTCSAVSAARNSSP